MRALPGIPDDDHADHAPAPEQQLVLLKMPDAQQLAKERADLQQQLEAAQEARMAADNALKGSRAWKALEKAKATEKGLAEQVRKLEVDLADGIYNGCK